MILTQLLLKPTLVSGVSTFTSLGSLGATSFSNDLLNFKPNQNVSAGKLIVILYAQSATNSVMPTVTDTKGNTYTLARNNSYHGVFYSKVSNALTTTDEIKFQGSSTNSRVVSAWLFDIPADKNVYVASSTIASNGYFNATPEMTLSGLPTRDYLFIRGIGLYHNGYTVSGITPTAGYTSITNAQYFSANSTDYVYIRGEWMIANNSTGTVSNPGDSFLDTMSRNVLAALYLAP